MGGPGLLLPQSPPRHLEALIWALSAACLRPGLAAQRVLEGSEEVRPLWRHYRQNTRAVIFVIDSNDRGRIPLAREELHVPAGGEARAQTRVLRRRVPPKRFKHA